MKNKTGKEKINKIDNKGDMLIILAVILNYFSIF